MEELSIFTRPTSIRSAYLGKSAQDLVRRTSDQVAELYLDRGLLIPVELSSTLHSLSYRDAATLTEIAKTLDQPHQLVAQRIHKLEALELLQREPDPKDRRRTRLVLTELGRKQAQILRQSMRDMAGVYEALYEEIGCDLPAMIQAALDAIATRSITDRMSDLLAPENDRNRKEDLPRDAI